MPPCYLSYCQRCQRNNIFIDQLNSASRLRDKTDVKEIMLGPCYKTENERGHKVLIEDEIANEALVSDNNVSKDNDDGETLHKKTKPSILTVESWRSLT